MTIIAAVRGDDGTVVMGGDSASVDDALRIDPGAESKVWQKGPLLFGACGSFRVAQVIRWHLDIPTPSLDDEPLAYLTGPLARCIREALAEHGALTTWDEDATENLTDSGLLIAYNGHIYEMYSDFGVHESTDNYAAVGCGRRWAEGAMFATPKWRPRRRVELALAAADRHSAGVVGPMHIEVLEA